MQYIYGLDFGTTNSALAILDLSTGEIVQTFTEKSVLFFPKKSKREHQAFVGTQAMEQYLAYSLEGRLMKSIKAILPNTSFTQTNVYGVAYTAAQLMALVMEALKKQADAFLKQNITTVVLGRPVVFSEDRRRDEVAQERLLKAAHLAGFEQVFFQYEPIAAAFAYERHIKHAQTVVVGDFGGGTSDFTIMQLDPKRAGLADRTADILDKDGVYVGGDNFDSEIMWKKLTPYFGYGLQYPSNGKLLDLPIHYFRSICSWKAMNFFKARKIQNDLAFYHQATRFHPALERLITLVTENLGYGLFRAIELAKMELSHQNNAQIQFQQLNILIQELLTLEEFNQIIAKDTQKINQHFIQFLRKNRLRPQHIDGVFITGGSSLVKAIQDIFFAKFEASKIHSGDTFNSVVNGLAYSAYLFV